MKTPVANTNDPAVERNISRSDMDIVIAVSDIIPELTEVPTQLAAIQVLEASIVDKASEIAANTLIVQSETPTIVSNAASALASKNAAELSEINASNSANSATISKDNALASAVSANASAHSALNSKDSASTSATTATTKASEALVSSTSAATSASAASTSATQSATSAEQSAASASSAASSATDANTSKLAAAVSASDASASESVATVKASEASVSATSASTSATTSTTQAGIAATKANEASVSASNALTSETNANDSEIMAHKWAQEAEGVEVAQGEYSAKHWATKARNIVYGGLTATGVSYNNDSGLTATNIQDAIDELLAEIGTKQDTLVSGTSIKTINGTSLLGSGNLDTTQTNITGNAGSASKLAIPRTINGVSFNGTSDITVSDDTKLPKSNPSIIGSITEQVYNLTGTAINPSNGTIQYKTVSANTTFTETLTSGQSVLLRLIGASSYTITFPTITWVGAVAPKLTANCAIVLWKEQSILYGAFVGTLV